MKKPTLIALVMLLALGACSQPGSRDQHGTPGYVAIPVSGLDGKLGEIVSRHRIRTAGIGVIRDGQLVWSRYYGEEQPGVPASEKTLFNVASITKTVAAEAVLRLVNDGRIGLDEPLSQYWIDPDVAQDPRSRALTARMVLTHTTGFPNWRFFRSDGKLTFEHDPGTTYGYSGEGFEFLARALERKLGEPFPKLVASRVLGPAGMKTTVFEVHRNGVEHLARAFDEQGMFPGYYCRPNKSCRADGSYSAADDMAVTVPDYAKFLASVMNAEGYGAALAKERDSVQIDKGDDRVVDCTKDATIDCPRAQGYGLGFEVIDYGNRKLVGHGGSDWSELTVAYFYEPSHHGVIVFLNAPNEWAVPAMAEILAMLDKASPYILDYQRRLERRK